MTDVYLVGPSKCGEGTGTTAECAFLQTPGVVPGPQEIRVRHRDGGGPPAGGGGLFRGPSEAEGGPGHLCWALAAWRACGAGRRRPALGPRGRGAQGGVRGAEAGAASSRQPVFWRLLSEQSDHNLSVPLPLQPHLPPDLSKQGKEPQTWQSPSLAAADSCQGTARAGAGPAPEGEPPGRGELVVAVLHASLELMPKTPHLPTPCADYEGGRGHP